MRRFFRFFVGIVTLLSFLLLSGCGGGNGNEGGNLVGSNLISSKVLDDINASTILGLVKTNLGVNATNAFGYKAIKITYRTKNIKGKDINASGLLVIPTPTKAFLQTPQGKKFSISAVCDNHGTIFLNSEAPTEVEKSTHLYPTALLMSGYAGFALIAPDYVGYGDSKGEIHPYIMKRSAQASLDMIRASVRYMTDHHILFNGQLFLSGYSEGGYVTMALAKEIEEKYNNEFKLMGVVPMAGPYDIKALADVDLQTNTPMVYPAFLAEIAYSYSKAYDLNLSNIVVKPQIFNSVNLFGGDYDTIPIHVALGLADINNSDYGFNTHYANELFKSSFINDYFTNSDNKMKKLFEENSVYNWKPKSKINLIQCLNDEIIPFAISSKKAYDTMIANGVTDINLTVIPDSYIPAATATTPFVHQRCAGVAYGIATKWFSDIRSGVIK